MAEERGEVNGQRGGSGCADYVWESENGDIIGVQFSLGNAEAGIGTIDEVTGIRGRQG